MLIRYMRHKICYLFANAFLNTSLLLKVGKRVILNTRRRGLSNTLLLDCKFWDFSVLLFLSFCYIRMAFKQISPLQQMNTNFNVLMSFTSIVWAHFIGPCHWIFMSILIVWCFLKSIKKYDYFLELSLILRQQMFDRNNIWFEVHSLATERSNGRTVGGMEVTQKSDKNVNRSCQAIFYIRSVTSSAIKRQTSAHMLTISR